MNATTYLLFDGNCEAAFKFYERCFGGKITAIMHYAGSPAESHVPADLKDKVLHASMEIGSTLLMASDCPPDRFQRPQGFAVALGLSSVPDAERIFKELAEGGKVEMPLQQTFWAARFGQLTDQFGVPWMINCEAAAPTTA
jgi:PhnB protein